LKKIINKDKIDNAFHYFDVDNNGVIDVTDLKTCMLRFGKKVVEDEGIKNTIIKFTNNSNIIEINYKQFLEIFKEIINVNDFIIN
jgi:Ca2+-binding EF-hand superfamily protein